MTKIRHSKLKMFAQKIIGKQDNTKMLKNLAANHKQTRISKKSLMSGEILDVQHLCYEKMQDNNQMKRVLPEQYLATNPGFQHQGIVIAL